MMRFANSGPVLKSVGVVAVIFGLLTILSGGMALFGGAEMGKTVQFSGRFCLCCGRYWSGAETIMGLVACFGDCHRISSGAGRVRPAFGPGRCV